MKDFLKKKWQMVLIVLLFMFSLSKCTQSCNRSIEIDNLNSRYEQLDSVYHSDINVAHDSIRVLNEQINIMEERVSGLRNMNDAVSAERGKTDEANRRAAVASQRERELRKQLNNQK